ncbi:MULTISPECIES: hypothetical protein [Leucobacter]|uniref:hypothetical protein n=1 Tax=Leucobacter TaxID=55968 RepID=UPI0021062B8E|nr:hypothetical protein [Leucobacter aridicollis]UTX51964.1 hypothetical protein KI794_09270 [Leucobacter aridicollis]
MLLSLWMMTQFALLTAAVAFGAAGPQSPVQLALVGAAGILALAPIVTVFLRGRRPTAVCPAQASRRRSRAASFRTFRVAADPGTPGSALARAPSLFVHSSVERRARHTHAA